MAKQPVTPPNAPKPDPRLKKGEAKKDETLPEMSAEEIAAKKAEEKEAARVQKEADKVKAKEEAEAAKLQAEADEIERVKNAPAVETDSLTSLAIAPYKASAVTEFGNSFMISLVKQAVVEEEAQKALNAAAEAKGFLAFEMTRAIFDLSTRFEEAPKNAVDVYAVFGEAKDVEKLNTNVLIQMGILRKEIDADDNVAIVWTDQSVEALYSYTKELKEKNEGEWTRRFNNRKRLNIRLNEAYRAVAILKDSGLTVSDLYYSEDKDGNLVPTIKNAPKAIGGDIGVVQMNVRTPVKGATLSPTMTSLVKLANDKHKAPAAERADKGDHRQGEAKLGMDDETFGRIVNTLRQAITTQEGKFSEDMLKHLNALHEFLEETLSEVA